MITSNGHENKEQKNAFGCNDRACKRDAVEKTRRSFYMRGLKLKNGMGDSNISFLILRHNTTIICVYICHLIVNNYVLDKESFRILSKNSICLRACLLRMK